MKEIREKVLIIIITLFIIFDPSIQKIKSGQKYLHSLFAESFSDEEAIDSVKTVVPISSQNALR
jgi:hypothetical protein